MTRRDYEPVTAWWRFVGQNIKGNPAMSARKVSHDLRKVRGHADVAVVQEFEWPWYWRVLGRVLLGATWGTFPGRLKGLGHPVRGAQAVFWRRRQLRAARRWQHLLHKGQAGISDDRWIRGVLLVDRKTHLGFCAGTTHNVVGGDERGDGPERKQMMAGDLDRLDELLGEMTATGYPGVFELDANIHRNSEAYARLREITTKYACTFHGELGVEYLFTWDAPKGSIEVSEHGVWTIPTSQLFTDHEGRGLTFRVRGPVERNHR